MRTHYIPAALIEFEPGYNLQARGQDRLKLPLP